MPFLDESQNPEFQPPVFNPPPPPAILPRVEAPIFAEALSKLSDGQDAFIVVHEKTQDGSVNSTNAAFVKRIGEDVVVTAWVGHDWGKPGIVSYGASMTWKF